MEQHNDHHVFDEEEYFFVEKVDGTPMNTSNRRRRFSVEYTPTTPRPPLYPPSLTTIETAESRLAVDNARVTTQSHVSEGSHPVELSSVLTAVFSGLWTVAPVLYLHCMNLHMLALFPAMLLIAALEVAIMALTLCQSLDDSNAIVAYFVALRVSAAYLTALPLDLPFEILEGLILFGSSSLVLETLVTQNGEIYHQKNQKSKRKTAVNFQRAIQW